MDSPRAPPKSVHFVCMPAQESCIRQACGRRNRKRVKTEGAAARSRYTSSRVEECVRHENEQRLTGGSTRDGILIVAVHLPVRFPRSAGARIVIRDAGADDGMRGYPILAFRIGQLSDREKGNPDRGASRRPRPEEGWPAKDRLAYVSVPVVVRRLVAGRRL